MRIGILLLSFLCLFAQEAKAKIKEQREEFGITEPKNLEEQAISLVGSDIYKILIIEGAYIYFIWSTTHCYFRINKHILFQSDTSCKIICRT